jgi:hypothetical protein
MTRALKITGIFTAVIAAFAAAVFYVPEYLDRRGN